MPKIDIAKGKTYQTQLYEKVLYSIGSIEFEIVSSDPVSSLGKNRQLNLYLRGRRLIKTYKTRRQSKTSKEKLRHTR
jgi:hypothetical protein